MQLEGSLEQFPLSELVDILTSSSVIGALHLCLRDAEGLIFFRTGKLYHAALAEHMGLEALWRMCGETKATFYVVTGETSERETLRRDASELMQEAQRENEMWAQTRHHIASLDWIAALRGRSSDAAVTISDTEWTVMSAIDGHRSVISIAREINHVPLEVATVLCSLADQGLVEFVPPHSADAPPTHAPTKPLERAIPPVMSAPAIQAPSVRPNSPKRPNFFERMLEKR